MTAQASEQQRLWSTIDRLREGFQIVDRQWRYAFVNQAVCAQGKKSREELLGRTMMECYPGIDGTPLFALLRRCMDERCAFDYDNEFTYPDGTNGWFELRIEPCEEGIFILSVDVTERRQLQMQLRQLQKMDAMGQLAGGIAHDFANVLTIIESYGSFALETLPTADQARGDVTEMMAAARRGSALTKKLLSFARRVPLETALIDMNEVIGGMSKMLDRVLGANIALTTVLGDGLGRVLGESSAIEQVVLNLAINARDAMPNGGKLTIETVSQRFSEPYRLSGAEVLPPGDYVQLAISDNGVGMSPELQQRIFEPFFTTKPVGRGTGLGLATCYGIVRQARGIIHVYSELGHGTSFKVFWPTGQAMPQPQPTPLLGGTIKHNALVVDDDAQVRMLTRRVLEREGFVVSDAADVDDAMAMAHGLGERLSLLITDVIMPVSSGQELAARLILLRPNMQVLFLSGYAEQAAQQNRLLSAGAKMLSKPFTPETLVAKVRALITPVAHHAS